MTIKPFHIVVTCFFLATTSTAAQSAAPLNATGPTVNDDLDGYFRIIWGLLIVLGIIFLLYGLLRKKLSLLGTSSSQREIEVLEIKPLMGKKALCLVRVRKRDFLLAMSGDRITLIDTLGEKEADFAGALHKAQGDLQQ